MQSAGAKKKSSGRVLVTGGAGFIGSHLVERLLNDGREVCVLDNFDDFYDPKIKRERVEVHRQFKNYELIEGDIRDDQTLIKVSHSGPFDTIVHLAALAGVRPSLMRPGEYIDVNVRGTQKLIELARAFETGSTRFLFASSSSVYGSRSTEAFVETDRVDRPESPYAASKAAGELICHAAHQCFALPVMCLRFFTVFGPRQRPDLAINKFCRLIEAGQPIELFGDGSSRRDYTYVDDTVSGIMSAMEIDFSGYEIINLGRGEPVTLNDLVHCIEKSLGKEAVRIYKHAQTGDVPNTHASIEKARRLLHYQPTTTLEAGIDNFVTWYRSSLLETAKTS
jgi:UDP-glucuronate 4-epimerase